MTIKPRKLISKSNKTRVKMVNRATMLTKMVKTTNKDRITIQAIKLVKTISKMANHRAM